MTKKQYISQLTGAGQGIRGKDVLEKDRVGVIDGLCDVIAEKDTVIAGKDTVIADLSTVIASKDADIARLNQMVKMFQRQISVVVGIFRAGDAEAGVVAQAGEGT